MSSTSALYASNKGYVASQKNSVPHLSHGDSSYASHFASRIASGSLTHNFILGNQNQPFSTPHYQAPRPNPSQGLSRFQTTVKVTSSSQSELSKNPEKRPPSPVSESQKSPSIGRVTNFSSKNEGLFSGSPKQSPIPNEKKIEAPLTTSLGNMNRIRMTRVESSGALQTSKSISGQNFPSFTHSQSPFPYSSGLIPPMQGTRTPSNIASAALNSHSQKITKMRGSNSEAKLAVSPNPMNSTQVLPGQSGFSSPNSASISSKLQSQPGRLSMNAKTQPSPNGQRNPLAGNNILQSSRFSTKKNGQVKAYGANTNQGLVRGYNEDRVSIVLSITKPPEFQDSRDLESSLFAVYDGHGGSKCAEFLRDNFYQYLIKNPNFPKTPKLALRETCLSIERDFITLAERKPLTVSSSNTSQAPEIDRSGSCAIVVLIISMLN